METNTTTAAILAKLQDRKGQFVSVAWTSEVKPAAAHKAHTLTKTVRAVCRAGIDFANLGAVKSAIANGERGEVESLPWGEWKAFPFLIGHKGQDYLRLYPSKQNKVASVYYVDGKEVNKEEFASYLQPAAAAKLMEPSETPDCLTVKVENILEAN